MPGQPAGQPETSRCTPKAPDPIKKAFGDGASFGDVEVRFAETSRCGSCRNVEVRFAETRPRRADVMTPTPPA